MAQGDPQELRELIAKMASAGESIHDTTTTLEGQSEALEQLDDDAKEAIGDLDDDLEKFLEKLDSGTDDAIEEVEDLTKAARDVADSRLEDASNEIDEAESAFASAVKAQGEELDKDDATLTMEGFGALGSDLNTVEEALNTSRAQTETAFENLETGVKDVGDKFTEAADDTSSKIGDGSTKAQEDETLVEDTGKECDSTMDSEASEAAQACESFEQSAKQYYEGTVDDEVTSDANGLIAGVSGLIDESASEIQTQVADDLEEPVGTLFSDSFDPHVEELGTVLEGVWKAQSTGLDLGPLVDNLVKSEHVVEVITQLNAEMGG